MDVQLDAAWMAASSGVSVVIASGKAKDGVLQVTAGTHSLPSADPFVFVVLYRTVGHSFPLLDMVLSGTIHLLLC